LFSQNSGLYIYTWRADRTSEVKECSNFRINNINFICDWFCEKHLPHTSMQFYKLDFVNEIWNRNFPQQLGYVGASCRPNCKSIAFTNLKLHIVIVGKTDVCGRSLFANSVTYTVGVINCTLWVRNLLICKIKLKIHILLIKQSEISSKSLVLTISFRMIQKQINYQTKSPGVLCNWHAYKTRIRDNQLFTTLARIKLGLSAFFMFQLHAWLPVFTGFSLLTGPNVVNELEEGRPWSVRHQLLTSNCFILLVLSH